MDTVAALQPRFEPTPPPPAEPMPKISVVDNTVSLIQEFARRAPFASMAVHVLVGVGLYVVLAQPRHRDHEHA